MAHYKISGVPITENGRLVGILTNRDLRFETRFHLPISEVMTKDGLVTVPVGTTLEEAQRILHKHRIEKLLVVDKNQNLKGLITVKDITKRSNIARRKGRPRTAAGGRGDRRNRRLSGTHVGVGASQGRCDCRRYCAWTLGPRAGSRAGNQAPVSGNGCDCRQHRDRRGGKGSNQSRSGCG
jgi:CBS-domain-containing membrane protein